MKRFAIGFVCALIVLSGCKEGALWNKPAPEEPGPKTKEEFLALFRPLIEPLHKAMPASPDAAQSGGLTDEAREQVIKALGEAKTTYDGNEAAQEAFRELGAEVSELAKKARDAGRWRLAMGCIDAHEVLGMKSYALERLRKQGKVILAQPKVRVQGFMEDKQSGVTTVFVELTDRDTGKITRVAKRTGDEFNGLRLVEILEQKNAVRFEYLPIEGMFFDVDGPRR